MVGGCASGRGAVEELMNGGSGNGAGPAGDLQLPSGASKTKKAGLLFIYQHAMLTIDMLAIRSKF